MKLYFSSLKYIDAILIYKQIYKLPFQISDNLPRTPCLFGVNKTRAWTKGPQLAADVFVTKNMLKHDTVDLECTVENPRGV